MAEPRRSSRISAQARPEPPAKRPRKGTATGDGAKSTKAGSTRKRSLKEDQEAGQDVEGDREQDAKKAKLPSAEDPHAEAAEAEAEADPPVAAPVLAPSELVTPSADRAPPGHVDIGETLPSLVLKNEKGEDVETATLALHRGVVFFLVPKADTPGCTTQACGFRDVWQEFGALDYDVYCLSADSPAAQTKWQTKKQLPYQLLSDPQRALIGALGAADGNKTKRSHFVFAKGGTLLDRKLPVKPTDSPRLALEFIKALGN